MCGDNHKERITWNKTMLIAEQITLLAVYKFILEIKVGFLINRLASQLKEFYIKPYLTALKYCVRDFQRRFHKDREMPVRARN